MSSTEHFVGSERLVSVLGHWPSFHDAEVISIAAERPLPVEVGAATVKLVVHVRNYETRGQGTAKYEQVLTKSVLATFLCRRVADFELSEFNHQNVINSLSAHHSESSEHPDSPTVVTIESIWGVGGTVRCSEIELVAVDLLPNAGA